MCAFRAAFANHEVLKVRMELVTGVLTGNSVALGATPFCRTDYSSFAGVPVAVSSVKALRPLCGVLCTALTAAFATGVGTV